MASKRAARRGMVGWDSRQVDSRESPSSSLATAGVLRTSSEFED